MNTYNKMCINRCKYDSCINWCINKCDNGCMNSGPRWSGVPLALFIVSANHAGDQDTLIGFADACTQAGVEQRQSPFAQMESSMFQSEGLKSQSHGLSQLQNTFLRLSLQSSRVWARFCRLPACLIDGVPCIELYM